MNCEPCQHRGRVREATREVFGEHWCNECFLEDDKPIKRRPGTFNRKEWYREYKRNWERARRARAAGQ